MKRKRKIDFVIGGVQKSGTSALATILSQHPNIFIPIQKELHFFNHSARFRLDCFSTYRSLIYWEYHRFFQGSNGASVLGEATPDYIYWNSASGNIWRYNPKMKWIVLLRHPVYRARSAWSMNRQRGLEEKDFRGALAVERQRSQLTLPYQNPMFSYLDRGRYAAHIRKLLTMFPRDQVLFLTTSELRNHHEETISKVLRFLAVQETPLSQKLVRVGATQNRIDRPLFSEVMREFEWDIRETSRLVDKDLSIWLSDDYFENGEFG